MNEGVIVTLTALGFYTYMVAKYLPILVEKLNQARIEKEIRLRELELEQVRDCTVDHLEERMIMEYELARERDLDKQLEGLRQQEIEEAAVQHNGDTTYDLH